MSNTINIKQPILASDMIKKLQKLIGDYGDLPVQLLLTDDFNNKEILMWGFGRGDEYWRDQATKESFLFSVCFNPEGKKTKGIQTRYLNI